ncbi:MAG: four helix bundle protein [Nitrospirota bacterium]|nr:four helix bundle protein [Nitrospirota bacterium]MDE3220927.1 four helix bundle protein [Nitrospirota bacterium]
MFSSFEDMSVWQKAMELAQKVFSLTEGLPRKEDYGLTSQVRRSALSVPGNLAEGFGRQHTKDKLNFYYASRGSLAETKNHLIYGQKVEYFKQSECLLAINLIDEIWKELNALIRSLRRTAQPQP